MSGCVKRTSGCEWVCWDSYVHVICTKRYVRISIQHKAPVSVLVGVFTQVGVYPINNSIIHSTAVYLSSPGWRVGCNTVYASTVSGGLGGVGHHGATVYNFACLQLK